MKSKYAIVALVLLSIMAFAFVAPAAAAQFNPLLTLKKTDDGSVWIITPWPDTFSAKDVDENSIHAYYGFIGDSVLYELPIKSVHIYADCIKLSFARKVLPQVTVDFSNVQGSLFSGDTFYATGPGFTWTNIH